MTAEILRRSILQRQGLIVPFEQPLDAVRAMVAVQTQYAASLPVAVAARVKRVKSDWDGKALERGGALVKSWSLRNTLHAHTVDDHALVVGTLGPHLYARYRRFMEENKATAMVDEFEAKVVVALQEGPLSRRELHDRVPELKSIEGVGWGLDVMGLALQRRLCIVGRGGEQRFCSLPDSPCQPKYAELLRRYLQSYGPASKPDFAFWTGLKGPEVQAAFKELAPELEPIQVEGANGTRYTLAEMSKEVPEGPLGVRLLAKFDPLVLSHRDKSLFISPELRTRVFRIAGQVEAVVLSEGLACATWRMERKARRVTYTIEIFRKLGKREVQKLEKEALRMAKILGFKEFEIQFV